MLTVSVLLENEARSETLAREHGLSLLLGCGDATVLLDAGQSDACLRNAAELERQGKPGLGAVTAIVLSHGHYDHSGGLAHVLPYFAARGASSRPPLIMHPDALLPRRRADAKTGGFKELGIPEASRVQLRGWPLRLSKEPLHLSEQLVYLGEIPRKYPETCALLGEAERDGVYEKDQLWDDTALAYISPKGLVVVAGCAHSGIINIVEHAKAVTGVESVHAVIGGTHMHDAGAALVDRTLRYFNEQNVALLRTCHCTGEALSRSPLQQPLHGGDYLEL